MSLCRTQILAPLELGRSGRLPSDFLSQGQRKRDHDNFGNRLEGSHTIQDAKCIGESESTMGIVLSSTVRAEFVVVERER
jgi:hypothetical protein